MWKYRLCLGTSPEYGISDAEQVRLFCETGFEGFFTRWTEDAPTAALAGLGRSLGIVYQSVHAPFHGVSDVWQEGPGGDAFISRLRGCLRDCADNGVGIMVSHVFSGFKDHTPTQIGVDRFGELVRYAGELGVRIGFENTEGEEYLYALLTAFRHERAAGFCWDSGHEICYSDRRDLLARYGDQLICTHLNDNLGASSPEISPRDDLHLLPFDGIGDWDGVAARLDRHGFRDFMTFEVKIKSKRGYHENDIYDRMDIRLYVAEAYKRACRVAAKRRL